MITTKASFLDKTYRMLLDPQVKEIISWNDDGQTFTIKDPTEFSEQILPRYFKHNNLNSFIRQLNSYGFNKCKGLLNEDNITFQNPNFIYGRPDLIEQITRKSTKKHLNKPKIPPYNLYKLFQTVYSDHVIIQKAGKSIDDLQSQVKSLKAQNDILSSELWRAKSRISGIENLLTTLIQFIQQQPNIVDLQLLCRWASENYLINFESYRPQKRHRSYGDFLNSFFDNSEESEAQVDLLDPFQKVK